MAHLTNKKRVKRDRCAKMRILNPKNTGTITMRSKKDYCRKDNRISLTEVADYE